MRGIYVLVIEARGFARLSIGSLKGVSLKQGCYAYVGSALGPGGNAVENRVRRHLSKHKKNFWHIDYLLAKRNIRIKRVFAAGTTPPMECGLAYELRRMGLDNAILGFGSSNCRCASHLLSFQKEVHPNLFSRILLTGFRRINLDPYEMSLRRLEHPELSRD